MFLVTRTKAGLIPRTLRLRGLKAKNTSGLFWFVFFKISQVTTVYDITNHK